MKVHEELVGLVPEEVTRRRFLFTSLAAGFALSVQPVTGQTVITTDAAGLVAGEVKVPVKDGEIPAYRAMPEKGKDFPVVLVVQEIFGVHEHIKDVCRRFAKLGHMALAPALYARQGDTSQLTDMNKVMEVVAKVPDAQVMSDLDATVAYAKSTGKGDAKKLAVTGFCWGGRIVWLYAAHNPDLDAGVAWYGRLVGRPGQAPNPNTPRQPVDVAGELKAPVLGLYGAKDRGIPVETVEQMRAALQKSPTKAAQASEIIVYPEADHGFHADYRPTYHRESATDAWRRLLAWFKRHGAA
jgi:carboxymethylenebutenolidase